MDGGASPATAFKGFPKLFKTLIMGIKIVMLSEILHDEKAQFFRSLCSANLTGCEGICPEANEILSAQGSLLSWNLAGIPQQMNHSSGKSVLVCTIKKENGTQNAFSRSVTGVE